MSATSPSTALIFVLDDTRYALPLASVVEVSMRVWLTDLPAARPPVIGIVVFRGSVTPVVSLRQRLGLMARVPKLSDHFLFVRSQGRVVGIEVDAVRGLETIDPERVPAAPTVERLVAGIEPLDDGVVYVLDLEGLLGLDDVRALDDALSNLREAPAP